MGLRRRDYVEGKEDGGGGGREEMDEINTERRIYTALWWHCVAGTPRVRGERDLPAPRVSLTRLALICILMNLF